MIGVVLFLAMLSGQGQAGPAASPPPTYRIRGVVVDATNGGPVTSAEVSIQADGDVIKTRSNGDGTFVLDGLAAGKYPLSAAAEGYVGERYNEHGGFSTAIVVGEGLDSEHIVFRLHPAALLYGTVTDENGEPVRQARAMLFEREGNDGNLFRGETQTNDLGEYRFAHLAAGRYHVVVQARPWYAENGFRYVRAGRQQYMTGFQGTQAKLNAALDVIYPITFYPGVTDENSAGEISLVAGETEEANIPLRPTQAMHVRVTGLPKNENNGLSIMATRKLFGSFDAYERTAVVQITPGEYEVSGLLPGNTTLTLRSGQGDENTAEVIKTRLNDGDEVDAENAGGSAKVAGRVVFPDGGRREGSVTLANDDGHMFNAKLQRDGTFSFAAIRGGVYKVRVEETNPQDYVAKIAATGAKTAGHNITVEGTGDVELSVTVGEGLGTIAGMAKLDGKAEAGVMILLAPESGEKLEDYARMDQSDSDGTFMLARIVPGKYVLMAIEDGWGLRWRDKEVLKPYLGKGQVLQIGANQKMDVSVEVQRRAK